MRRLALRRACEYFHSTEWRGAPAIALDVHLNDGGLVNEAIDGGERHGGVAETKVPLFVGGSCLTSRSRTRIIFCLSTG